MDNKFSIETNCVQGAYQPKNGESRVMPIVQSTTWKYSTTEQMGRLFDLEESGYFYTRLANPTSDLVAAKKELFNLRFQNATNQLDNTSRIKEVRRNIARIQTVISAKETEQN